MRAGGRCADDGPMHALDLLRGRAGGRVAALAAVGLTTAAAAAAPASATMLVYRDSNDVWAASPDGALTQRVTADGTDAAYYAFPSADDAGTITAIKGSSTTRVIWVLARGAAQPIVNAMPWKAGGWPNVGPLSARVNASGGSLAYTYHLNHGPFSGYPNGGLETRYAIVTPTAPGSPTQPAIDQPSQTNPTWFGNRLVSARGGSIYFETQPLQHTSWLSDPNNPNLLAAEVDRAGRRVMVLRGDGRVVIAGWQGTVGSTAGTVTSQCLLPGTGIESAALSPDGTQVAWSGPSGLYVASVGAVTATSCPLSGTVRLSATGKTPSFSAATLPPPPDPGRRDPTDPGRRDPTDPGRRDPTDPGDPRDPTDPGDPLDPGDPADPGDPGRGGDLGGGQRDQGGGGTVGPGDRGQDGPRPRTTIEPGGQLRLTAPGGRAAGAGALRRGVRVVVSAPAAGTVRLAVALRTAGARPRTIALGGARAAVAGAGRRVLVVRPSLAARGQLRRGARLTLTVTFTPAAGRAVVRRATVAVR